MSGASALYVPPDPNTAPGTRELGNEKSAFKIFDEKIFAEAGCRPATQWSVIDRPPFGGPDKAVVGEPHRMERRPDLAPQWPRTSNSTGKSGARS